MKAFFYVAGFAVSLSLAGAAQAAEPVAEKVEDASPAVTGPPVIVAQPQLQTTSVLPANTEITLTMNYAITTKGNRWSEGDTFEMSVSHDVMLGNYVVIPRGTKGVGRITWLTNKGAFGKSGKMEIDIEYVELAGRRIPVTGHYRQEGEGNTVATVGGVVAAGVFAGFVTGRSGTIPQGRELTARTRDDLPVAFAGPAPSPVAAPIVAQPVAPPQPVVANAAPAEGAEQANVEHAKGEAAPPK